MDSLIQDNLVCLRQGITLLAQLSDVIYSTSVKQSYGSSIGAHMRHNIDHYHSLLNGIDGGCIDYDVRLRDPRIETKTNSATEALNDILASLAQLNDSDLDKTLRVKMDCGSGNSEDAVWSQSSVRRELQFLISHTVHHYALIGVMTKLQGLELPEHFGVAPSTLKYRESLASGCAR